jgi:hypothetical protein
MTKLSYKVPYKSIRSVLNGTKVNILPVISKLKYNM